MKAVILGHFVLDEIHPLDGSVIHSPGGIAFCLGGFNAVAREADVILPVLPVGNDGWEQFQTFVSDLPGIRTDAIHETTQPTTRVRLYHDSLSAYHTRLAAALPPIPAATIRPWLDGADMLYVNMMTGEDITVDTARALRAEFSGLFYLDLHMLAYRNTPDGDRHICAASKAEEWMGIVDVMQCNHEELVALSLPNEEPEISISRILRGGTLSMLVVTRGEQGADLYCRDGSHTHIPSHPQVQIVDPTGCGDVFGSVLAWGLASRLPLEIAATRAARAAAHVAGLRGAVGIADLRTGMHEEFV